MNLLSKPQDMSWELSQEQMENGLFYGQSYIFADWTNSQIVTHEEHT